MTAYELWLFLHLSAMALWMGGAVAVQVFAALAKASGDPARSAALGKDTGVVVRWIFMPSSLVVLVSGVLLVNEGASDADCTFSTSEENFEKIVAGEQNPTTAYMTGKLKIKGDMGAAMKLQKLF